MDDACFVVARLATYATLLLAAGVPLYLTAARERGAWRLSGGVTLAAMAASAWWVLEAIASMAGQPVGQIDPEMAFAVLDATPLGMVMVVRLVALLAALAALWRCNMGLAALAASVALATMAWTGHAGAGEGGTGALHRASDVVHLLAASIWTGALTLFSGAAISSQDRETLLRRLSAFATIGSAIVVLLLLTGIANTLAIAGWPIDLASTWTWLLGAKLALFLGMLALAVFNRWLLTPRLARDPTGNLGYLKLSLALETGAAFLILAIVSWLGVLSPS
ncbi:copper homeostasis membrane protein CopD [Sphingosinicella sp.]|uniref:copper homeostasis membrane protein CopD n=1 Tax=Sphingosinicella sp. TaxID=1917971 RepID=UPI0017F4ADE5|nr:copper homeostasis membrane protein CopD [Sphingosinicella sp.]MBA4759648.1 copper homeostasis membrane protein CopD [Sphingosinicella sp.]